MSHKMNRYLVAGLCALACVTMVTYALASGASQSLFISAYGAKNLPWAWLAVAVGSAMVTYALTRAAKHVDLVRLFGRSCFISAVSLSALLIAHAWGVPHTSFALYVWKDVYIIVLVELFWTFANVAFGLRSAPRIYGYFCAAGSLGSVSGGLVLGPLGQVFGTANMMWLILPMLAVLGGGTMALAGRVHVPHAQGEQETEDEDVAIKFWHNPYLMWLAALVALAQVMITLTEFRFSHMLEAMLIVEGDRTSMIGLVSAITNSLSLLVQLVSPQIFALFGMPRTLLALPWLLSITFLSTLQAPGLLTTSACQIAGKTVDYSLFRAAKEMLYIPLSYAEKTQGKALVDILIYRIARGGASMLLLVLGTRLHIDWLLGIISVLLSVLWLGCVVGILRRYRRAIRKHSKA
jgi:AAA family ATP:ADP antiporter